MLLSQSFGGFHNCLVMTLPSEQSRYSPPIATAFTTGRRGPLAVSRTSEDIRKHTGWEIHQDEHMIIIHLHGEMRGLETRIEGQRIYRGPAVPGGVWLIPGGSRYSSHACGRTIEYAHLEISRSALSELSNNADATCGELNLSFGTPDPFMFRAVNRLFELWHSTDDVSLMTSDSIAHAMCWHIIDRYGRASRRERSTGPHALSAKTQQHLVDFIYDSIDKRIRVSELAEIAATTESEFFSRFHKAFGATPGHYITQQRLNRACWLLANTSSHITRIAYETGFSSHSHLTTAFKKRLGITPSEFRRRQRG